MRDWFRSGPLSDGLRRLADRLPILWDGTALDGELTAGRFSLIAMYRQLRAQSAASEGQVCVAFRSYLRVGESAQY